MFNPVRGDMDGNVEDVVGEKLFVNIRSLWSEYIKAFINIVVKTTWFGEYILPILLAGVGVVVYMLDIKWGGVVLK